MKRRNVVASGLNATIRSGSLRRSAIIGEAVWRRQSDVGSELHGIRKMRVVLVEECSKGVWLGI